MNALARSTDPATSHAAARRVPSFSGGQYKKIMESLSAILHVFPEHGATAAEIAGHSGLTVVQIDRRLPELRAAGRVEVLKHDDGADVVRNGYRCWGLV